MMDYEARGIPFGRPAEVNLRNNHAQYIFTWYVRAKRDSSSIYLQRNTKDEARKQRRRSEGSIILTNSSDSQVRVEHRHVNHAVHGAQKAAVQHCPPRSGQRIHVKRLCSIKQWRTHVGEEGR